MDHYVLFSTIYYCEKPVGQSHLNRTAIKHLGIECHFIYERFYIFNRKALFILEILFCSIIKIDGIK